MSFHLDRWLKSTVFTLGILLVFLVTLEIQSPRFFSWDDNATQFCGYYQYNYDAIFHQKTFPWMVWTQYCGQTNLSQSQCGVFYLPAYTATALSWAIFDSPLWNIDLLIIAHLLFGAWGMVRFLRFCGLSPEISNAAGLLYATTPFLIIVSRSWIFVTYSMAYTPWIFHLIERLLRNPTKKEIINYVLLKSLFFCQGYSHVWINLSFIEGLYFIYRWMTLNVSFEWKGLLALKIFLNKIKTLNLQSLKAYLSAQALHLLIISPLLWINIQTVRDSPFRGSKIPINQILAFRLDPADGFLSQLFFFQPMRYLESSSAIMFFGGSVLFLYFIYCKLKSKESWESHHSTLFIFLIATVLLSTSFYVVITPIPPFDILRWPLKFMVIAPFFYSAAFSFFESIKVKFTNIKMSSILFFCSMMQIAVIYIPQNQMPFSKLKTQSLHDFQTQWSYREGRVLPVASDDQYAVKPELLTYNFGTSAQIPTFAGYDQLINKVNYQISLMIQVPGTIEAEEVASNLGHLQTWGVRYYTGSPLDPKINLMDLIPQLRRIYENKNLIVWEDQEAFPLIAEKTNPMQSINFKTTPQSLFFTPNNLPGHYTVRFAPLSNLKYRIENFGVFGSWQPIQINNDSTIDLSIQESATKVEIAYKPDQILLSLFLISGVSITLLLILYFSYLRIEF